MTTEPPKDDSDDRGDGRDDRGRFTTGNPGGPGSPSGRRRSAYQHAIAEAITPDHLRLLMQRMLQLAVKDGDVQAAKLVADRCLGRVNSDPLGEGIAAGLPLVDSVPSVLEAINTLLQAAARGDIAPESVHSLSGIVERARQVHATKLLEEDLESLRSEIAAIKRERL